MATGLDSPPENDEQKGALFDSGTPQGVYDNEFQKIRERSLADVDSDNSSDLKSAEESAGAPLLTDAEEAEKNLTDTSDQVGSGYRHEGQSTSKRKIKSRLSSRQKAAGGGIIALLIGGTLGIATIVQGPLQVVQFGKLLSKNFSIGDDIVEGRVGNLYRWARHPGNPEMRRLSVLGNRIANKVEAKWKSAGLNPVYDKGRLVRFDVDTSKVSVSELRRSGVDVTLSSNGQPTVEIDASGTKKSMARKQLKSVNKAVPTLAGSKVGAIGARTAKTKAGINMGNVVNPRRTTQDRKAKKAEYEKNKQADIEGNQRIRGGTATDIDDEGNKSNSRKISDSKAAKGAIRTAGGVGLVCVAWQLSDPSGTVRRANVILPLMRHSGRYITVASQVQSGNFDLEELGFLAGELYDEETQTSAFSARPMQAMYGQSLTGSDIPDEAHPTRSQGALERILGNFPLGGAVDSVCNKMASVAGQAVGWVADIAICIGTGGLGCVAKLAVEEAVSEIAVNTAANVLAGEEISTAMKGGVNGAYAAHGARLLANENMITFGGRELTETETAQLESHYAQIQREEFNKKSLVSKLLDPYETDSLLAKGIIRNPSLATPKASFAAIIKIPFTLLSSITANITSVGQPNAYADTRTYEWGYNQFGFDLDSELDNETYDNPYDNAKKVWNKIENEDKFDDYKKRVNQCFGLDLQSDGTLHPLKDQVRVVDSKTRREGKCGDTDSDFTRLRFYVLDMMAAESVACFEGDESACRNIGFGNSATNNTQSSNQVIDGQLGELQCPSNLEVHPTESGYYRMPATATNGEYTVYSVSSKRWGSRELICVIHTVSLTYNEAMQGKSKMRIGNLNTPVGQPSKSHRWGVGIDISAAGEIQAASHNQTWKGTYSKEATILIGKLLVDTGKIKNIWWCPPSGDNSIQEIRNYAQSKGTPINIKCISGHADHFHVDLKDQYRLRVYSP